MPKENTSGLKTESGRLLILLLTTAVCSASALYFVLIRDMVGAHTHVFYVPIALAGMWYHRKAVYVALFLSMVYLLAIHFSPLSITIDAVVRTAAFVAVAYLIGYISSKRAKGEEGLRESEEKYRNLIDQSQDAIYLLYEGKFELINKRFEGLFGYTLGEAKAPGFGSLNLVASQSRAMVEERREKVARGESVSSRYEFTALSRDGTEIEVETSNSYIEYKGGIAVQGIVRDITERKRAERRIEHLNLVLRAIRNVNQLITREKDRDKLLKGACETLIETRGYHHGWIAIFDESGGLVTTAHAGLDILPLVEYLRRGELPVCVQRALQQSQVVVMEDAPSDCADCPLTAEHPGTITMTVRLAHAGKVYGVLNVSLAADLNAHEEEESLFGEVADDIALALHSIELEETRKRMDREIEERQEYLASVLRHVPDAIITDDASSRIVEWNPGAERLFGYTYDEAQGKDADDLITQPDVEEEARFFTKQTRRGGVPPTEVVRYRKDGTPVTLIMASSPIMIEDELQGTVAVYTDITERKRIEREMEERREYLASVLRHAPDAIVTTDDAYRIVEWNPGAERLFGYSRDEVQGKDVDDLIARLDIEEQARFFSKQVLAGKELPLTEVVRYRKDGTPVNVILAGSPIVIRDELRGVVAVYTDITERKRAEESLRKKTEQVIRHQTALLELTKLDYSNLESALRGITEMASKTLNVERVNVCLFNEDHSAITCQALYKLSESLHVKGLRVKAFDYPQYFQALKDGRVIAANDACTDPRTSEFSVGYLEPFGITSMLDVPIRLHGELMGIVGHEHVGPTREWTLEEQDFAASIADIASLVLESSERKRAEEALESSFIQLAETVSRAMESQDPYTVGHQQKVSELAKAVGGKMGFDQERLLGLYIAGLLHDIGKIAIPAEILTHPGKLSEPEWALIRSHPRRGYEILQETEFPWPIADIILHHHERLDGSGYPDGLKGDELSLEVRILAVCDVVDAMLSDRPYRPARSKEEVVDELHTGRGIKYDSQVVDILLEMIEKRE